MRLFCGLISLIFYAELPTSFSSDMNSTDVFNFIAAKNPRLQNKISFIIEQDIDGEFYQDLNEADIESAAGVDSLTTLEVKRLLGYKKTSGHPLDFSNRNPRRTSLEGKEMLDIFAVSMSLLSNLPCETLTKKSNAISDILWNWCSSRRIPLERRKKGFKH